MQYSNPKQPGFVINPIPKTPNYISLIDRNPVAEEPEISNSLKRGMLNELVKPENDDETPNPSFLGKLVVFSRCHSLGHYKRVRDPRVENLFARF
ncbi:hypothetical protein RHMOL_Rhmol01G0250900 [Rhododendron molle]|uniref:Uncharacterized protein n=1 Tax=Rhododendron molle TaxID=49168 RepID=A0ACC0Q512_RHOML|nr:hypothetical protein RHMOL_Rhmol01G0250900 [Rhododendron molle]